jgi:cystathionine gamma-synthase/methionine-gamma-lyase
MTSQNTNRLATRCIHAGETLDEKGAIHTPLYNHSTFGFTSTAAVLDVVEGRKQGSLYTRYGLNPTIRSIEEKLASIEGGEAAWVFSSGMAAESATILTHCKAGDHIICLGDVYGGTFELLESNLLFRNAKQPKHGGVRHRCNRGDRPIQGSAIRC